MLTQILTYSFYLLFALTPLIWAPWTSELFEFNKMFFVYALTIIITATWLLKIINQQSLILNRTPLDIPLLLFLGASILSTVFSIDRHISIFGYYSRLNGGLLSLISYLLLYYALISNFNKEQALKFFKAALLGGILVALWAIPEHFGVSLSCILLTGKADAACWVQDVQARVFATLGQPNWLAAYLAMLIFPTLYFLMTSTKRFSTLLYTLYLTLFYLAFTFTYSRGATLGLMAGFATFIIAICWLILKKFPVRPRQSLLVILVIFLLVNLVFGSALTNFKLISKFAPPSRPALTTAVKSSGTQLETGGTESGKIRLIVWQGALDIFKAYPIFGSGLETFAYAYYQYRPASHNLVSEWDFLYNKAHNEFLNYLATTGLVGFFSYMAIIISLSLYSIKYLVSRKNAPTNPSLHTTYYILNISILASYTSYLVQNFFLFSVVTTALFFYLFPAILFVVTDSAKPIKIPSSLHTASYILLNTIYKRPFYTKLTQGIIILVFGLLLFTLVKFYLADTYFAQGMKVSSSNPGKAYNLLYQAVTLNKIEPYYQSELAYLAAAAAVSLEKEDATLSAQLKEQAKEQTSSLLNKYPQNVSYLKTAVRTYYLLSTIDQKFVQKTLETLDQALKLAPTDAKLLYNKGVILDQQNQTKEAVSALEKTLKLKPNYREAYLTLSTLYAQEKQLDKAKETIEAMFQFYPNDPDGLEKLKEWQ